MNNLQTTTLSIDSIVIRQDSEGRYCLNDLHKAAGGENKHKPSLWMTNESTRDLIAELGDAGNPASVIRGGLNQGTFVCKELVYAYAMWISPKFNLKVIRAYDTLATQGVAVHENHAEEMLNNPLKYMRTLLEQAEAEVARRVAAEAALTLAAPKVAVFDNHVADRGDSLLSFARTLEGVNTQSIKKSLMRLHYLYKRGNRYNVYAKYRDSLFVEKLDGYSGNYEIYPTADGKKLLVELYKDGLLIMKAGYQPV